MYTGLPRIPICALSLLLLLLPPFIWVHASNYDAYLDMVHQRNRRLAQAYGSGLDSDWHHEVSNNLYDSEGFLRGVGESDSDAEEAWQRIQRSISDYRQRNRQAMQDYHKRLPQLLQGEPRDYLGTSEEDAEHFYSLLYPPPNVSSRSSGSSGVEEEGESERFDRNEVPFENDLWGEHRVSGGNGRPEKFPSTSTDGNKSTDSKSQANAFVKSQEVKTDRLPGYCDPPNPCPIGMDLSKATAPCDRNIENTKAFNRNWNWSKMQNGECTCDREHMHSCPTPAPDNVYDKNLNHRNSPPLSELHEHQSIKKKAGPKMFNLVDM